MSSSYWPMTGTINDEQRATDFGQWTIREEEYECFMDCQYEYFLAGDSDYHGFLSYHAGKCINPLDKKGVVTYNFGSRTSLVY
jgi:hypothetical protein